MRIYHNIFISLCLFIELAGLYIFFKGFFPIKLAIPGRATWTDIPAEPIDSETQNPDVNQPLKPAFGKLVIVLIDALRADFVFGEKSQQHMPFTSRLIREGKTRSFLAKAHPPTVTMPRIKAITTGSIPGFVDVVFNMDSSALTEDNIISQLYHAGSDIIFFGDDTWIKLFPKFFKRSDGTTSFFVTDYTEVDNNVTRHIDKELVSSDWDVMILHYLGLDHIGHLSGPTSPLVEPKLKEMDQIVEHTLTQLSKQENTATLPSLIVLCGDHGMSDVGSHGGASASETTTPLVFMSSKYMKKHGQPYTEMEVKQIDLAPTLSLVLGLPIPQNSLGRSITQLLQILPIRDQLRALQVNAHQLVQVLKKNVNSYETEPGYLQYQRALKHHSSWLVSYTRSTSSINHELLGLKIIEQYSEAIQEISHRIASSLAKYDEHALVVGVFLFWQVLCAFLYGASHLNKGGTDEVSLPIGGQSSTFILIGCCLAILSVQVKVCTDITGGASEVLCDNSVPAIFLSSIFVLSSATFVTVFLQCLLPVSRIKLCLETLNLTGGQKILVASTAIHTFSLLSSSFVEEEHQTWYFFTMTLMLYLLYKAISPLLQLRNLSEDVNVATMEKEVKTTLVHTQTLAGGETVFEGKITERSSFGQKHSEQDGDTSTKSLYKKCGSEDDCDQRDGWLQQKMKMTNDSTGESNDRSGHAMKCTKTLLSVALVVVCGRLLRAWNQTGMKWADRPDIGDWFVRPENKLPLSALVTVCFLIICVTRHRRGCCHPLLLAFSLVGVYFYRAATCIIITPFSSSTEPEKGLYQAWLVYALTLCYITHTLYAFVRGIKHASARPNKMKETDRGHQQILVDCAENVYNIGIVLTALLLRPHNVAVLALLVIQEQEVTTVIWPALLSESPAWTVALLHLWFGTAAFYAQGNSNSPATIDISAGYIGQESHNTVIAGVLTLLATYGCLLLWILSLLIYIMKNYFHRYNESLQEIVYTFGLTRALPVAVYAILVSFQRYHLFVWSVFSPKVMYEGMLVFVYSTVICLLSIHSLVVQKLNFPKTSSN